MNQHSKIAILGFGEEGKAMLEYFQNHEYNDVTVCDQNVDLQAEMPEGVSVRLGEDYLKNLSDFDVLVRSPGIKYMHPQIQTAKNAGAEVTSAVKFFLEMCPCPVVGVSGTKGKGTTSTLIYEMLREGSLDAYLGGNIGEPPVIFLDKLKANSIVVLELSSFQLQDLELSPKYAVLLNTTSDHLDYHVDKGEYLQAKESLLAHQNENSVAVLNKDYEYSKYYEPLVKGDKLLISVGGKVKNGAFVEAGMIYFAKNGKNESILPMWEAALIGSHNLENILPSICIAKSLGVKSSAIKKIIKTFKGLPHRLEFVKEVGGVKYYNDSFSTTPETSMAAVDSFDEPLILIAGGYDKGLDYQDWALKILTRINLHTVILIGDLAEKMESELVEAEEKLGGAMGSPTRILRRDDLEEAVLAAYAESDSGGVVVMSPAAASFDMFENYKERGKAFMDAVKKLR